MTDKQKAIIERLFDAGSITLEDVMELSANCGAKDKEEKHPQFLNPLEEKTEVNIVDKITNDLFDKWEDEDGDESLVFDYPTVLKYYKDHDWRWFNTPNGIKFDDLKECVHSLVESVVNNIKEQIRDGEEFPYSTTSTGGLEIVGHLEDGDFIFELKFVPVIGDVFIPQDELK